MTSHTTVKRHQKPTQAKQAAPADEPAVRPDEATRLVTVVALVSHDTMLAGERHTVPYTARLQELINRGYLDPAIDDDPLAWMSLE